MMFSSGL